MDAALLKPLPVKDPESLRLVEWTSNGWPDDLCNMMTGDTDDTAGHNTGSSIAPRIYRDLAQRQHSFDSLIGFSDPNTVGAVIQNRAAERLNLQYVSPNFFSGLGISPRLGRAFATAEDQVGQAPLLVISDRLWRSRFGGSEGVLGQVVRINSVPARIIGVLPRGFFGIKIGEWEDLYAPLAAQVELSPRVKLDKSLGESDKFWWVRGMARIKPGANDARAIEELSALFRHQVVPPGMRLPPNKVPTLIAKPGWRGFDPIDPNATRALWIVLLLIVLILLIVCANVANLLLSRAVARQRESAVCLALGAGRLRLFRQYLIESVILALAGGLSGLALTDLLLRTIQYFLRTDLNIGEFNLRADGRMLGFTLLVSLATSLLFGLAPAWQLVRATVQSALKANSRTVMRGRLRLPRLLVAIQVGLCLTVLMAATLLGRSLTNLRSVNIGFERKNLIYASVDPWSTGYRPEQVTGYGERLRDRLHAIPGVQKVALIEEMPLSGAANVTVVHLPGQPYRNDSEHFLMINSISPDLFETLGISLLAGRTFQPADMREKSDAVIVDELFAKRFYPHESPVGRQFSTGPELRELRRIIGVVKNSSYDTLREAGKPTMFQPLVTASRPGWSLHFALRAAVDAKKLSEAIRKVAAELDPTVPVVDIKTQSALIDRLLLFERLLSVLSTGFGVLALILSAMGLLALLGYTVTRRTNEIGVRMALGAQTGDVIRLVIKDSLLLVAAGTAIGLPSAYVLGRYLQHTLFDLEPTDPVSAAIALLTLGAAATLASWLPAWRATHVEPVAALREE